MPTQLPSRIDPPPPRALNLLGNLLPDARWIDLLRQPTQVFVGLFLFSTLALVLDSLRFIDLLLFGGLMRPTLVLVMLFFGSLSVSAIGKLLWEWWTRRKDKKRAEELTREQEARVLSRLDHLSNHELHIVADCLRKSERSFLTDVNSPPVANLMAYGLVGTPGGQHHRNFYPFFFVDFVWAALLARSTEFIAKDDENERQEAEQRERTNRLLPP
jgi:hypothetical protein